MYILKCSDSSFYIGHTNNIQERLIRHNSGRGAKWTAARLPVNLLYKEFFISEQDSIKRELQIKKWSRNKKEALINGDFEKLKSLSKRHHP